MLEKFFLDTTILVCAIFAFGVCFGALGAALFYKTGGNDAPLDAEPTQKPVGPPNAKVEAKPPLYTHKTTTTITTERPRKKNNQKKKATRKKARYVRKDR